MSEKKVELKVLEVSQSQTQAQAYALLLGEAGGNRQLPIIIGASEALAIMFSLNGSVPRTPLRPFTHDLFLKITDRVKMSITEVLIYKVNEGVFYAKIYFKNEEEAFYLDSRPSDAIALALRTGCPIYIYESILAAESLDLESHQPVPKSSGQSLEVLKKALNKAIKNENYELAALLNKQIKEIENEKGDFSN